MKFNNLFSLSVLSLSLALAACSPKHSLSASSLRSGLLAAIDSSSDSQDQNTAKKVRIREDNGKKVFEYLVPHSAEEKWISYGQIEIHKAGSQFHHWGPEKDVKYWASQGIDTKDIDRAVRSRDDRDVMGGGFYASLNTIDSSDYGPNLLVIEPRHDVVTLDVTTVGQNFDKDRKAVLDQRNNVYIPVSMMAEAGVETIRYSDTWMVCISGKPLEHLFEGSWNNFLKRAQTENIDFGTLIKFSTKYPLTADVWSSADFKKSFPVLGQYLNHQPMDDKDVDSLVESYMTALNSPNSMASFSIMNVSSMLSSDPWKDLMIQIKPKIKVKLIAYLKEMVAKKDFQKFDSQLTLIMNAFGLSLEEVAVDSKIYLDPNLNVSSYGQGLTYKSLDRTLQSNLPLMNLYEILARLENGAKEVDEIFGYTKGDASPYDKARAAVSTYSWSDPAASMKLVASFITKQELKLREKPQLVTGDFYLDGPSQPGYLLITSQQRDELKANPYITPIFKEVTAADGSKQIYVRYETPSARNYKQFVSLLNDPMLVQKLNDAEKKGDLASESSPIFAQLTTEISANLLKTVFFQTLSSPGRAVSELAKIQPFADPDLNLQVLEAFYYVQFGRALNLLDPTWARVATDLEMMIIANQGYNVSFAFQKTIASYGAIPNTNAIDLTKDIGFWEVAANRGGPHKDNAKFIEKVKARFEAADVQQWLKNKQYGKILQALHEAGADQ